MSDTPEHRNSRHRRWRPMASGAASSPSWERFSPCIGIAWLLFSIIVLSKREKTDDAYVVGNQVRISAQTPGTVVEVLARNTSRVAAGQVLLRLDTTDAQQAVDRAEAALAQAVRQVRQQQAQTHQYDAMVSARTLELQNAQADLARREPLLAEKAVSDEEVRHARDAVALARAQLDAGTADAHRHQCAGGRDHRAGQPHGPAAAGAVQGRVDRPAAHFHRCAHEWLHRAAQRATGPAHTAWRTPDERDSAAGRVARGQLQGAAAAPPAHRAAGDASPATSTAAASYSMAMSLACRPAPAPRSRCCRRRMHRATGSRWCSAWP